MNTENYIFLSIISSCLAIFFQFTLQKGKIFRKWLFFLFWVRYKVRRSKSLFQLAKWVSKPLGVCIYCNGTWIAIITYLLHFEVKNFVGLWSLFLFLGLNYVVTKILFERLE